MPPRRCSARRRRYSSPTPERALPLYLGFFASFLLYIGASDILPRAHRAGSNRAALALTILGTAFAFGVTRFA